MMTVRLLLCWAFLSFASPVTALAQELNAADREFFEDRVRPILVEHCYDCHSAEMGISGGLGLDTASAVLKGGDTGRVVVPGHPEKSLLIEAVTYENRDLQMPPLEKLADEQINVLKEWVTRGVPDPRVEIAPNAQAAPTGMSIEEGREFWSFQPIENPEPPSVQDSSWVKNPIDAFVLARLEQEGLHPAPRAEGETLLRRVTFNLTGLPPKPNDLKRFQNDDSPEAFEKVVDRLLASPQYGVHWGRHWLDVARYADSNGLDENIAYGNAWRYRDYVVNAFNEDKPYDQFVIEQLAGDLLPEATRETKTATGFLGLGAKVLAEPDRNKLDMDIIDEQLDTTGKAFLGLTLGCVRCHDHKFDPLKQSDYYALAAIFKSTRTLSDDSRGAIKYWYEHSFATEADKKELEKVNAEIQEYKQAASSFKSRAINQLREQSREQAADYLAAASLIDPQMSLKAIEEVASPWKLHPRILHHCRLHLEYHRDDPVFETWHQLQSTKGAEAVRQHYRELFDEVDQAMDEQGDGKPLKDDRLEAARLARNDRSGFLAIPSKVEHAFDEATLTEYHRLMEVARKFESRAMDDPAAMGVADGEVVAELPIHIRGSYKNPGKPVSRHFPEAISLSSEFPLPEDESGRLQLARWMVHPQHPLTARVIVNRIWGWHFGQPLVTSTENFGVMGSRPSHPELLDWLATYLIQHNWSIKSLNRLILTSNTYQLAASHPMETECEKVDQENRLLWRANLQRLPAESIRDAILSVSGQLDDSLGGKTIPLRNRQFVFNHTSEDHTDYHSKRRSLYLPIVRNNLYPMFEQFNYPDPTMPTGHRTTTTVAPQALWMMNSPLVIEAAARFAADLCSEYDQPSDRIDAAYRRAYGRSPSQDELSRDLDYLSSARQAESDEAAWTLYCQSLFAANEFIYLQ